VIEVDAPAVTLTASEASAGIRAAAEQSVEVHQCRLSETAGEAGTRQPRELAQRAHAHGLETQVLLLRPTQHGDGQRRKARRQHARIGDETTRTRARRHGRRERGRCEREMRCDTVRGERRIRETERAQLPAELPQPTKKRDARLDFEQQSIGRFDRHARRECGRNGGQALHERCLARVIARARIDVGRGCERRTQRHADAYTGGCGARRGRDDPRARGIEHDERSCASSRMQRAQGEVGHVRGNPELARLERECSLISRPRSRGRGRRRPDP
jgi:hypothetical protein